MHIPEFGPSFPYFGVSLYLHLSALKGGLILQILENVQKQYEIWQSNTSIHERQRALLWIIAA